MAPRGSHRARAVQRVRARRGLMAPLPHAFPSPEWVAAYRTAIVASDDYRAASGEWTHGPVALVIPAQPDIGVPDDIGIWLDLERGDCRAARVVTRDEAQGAPFVL